MSVSVYVPYCSSDLYSGTRNASTETNGRVFYGKHIIQAIIDDLIADNWIQQAEKVDNEDAIAFRKKHKLLHEGCFDRNLGWRIRRLC